MADKYRSLDGRLVPYDNSPFAHRSVSRELRMGLPQHPLVHVEDA
jgi:hypothetical protein